MKIISVRTYDCITYTVEDGSVVIYGLKEGKIVERHIVDQLAVPAKQPDSMLIVLGITMAVGVLIMVLIILGYPNVAQALLDILLHIVIQP